MTEGQETVSIQAGDDPTAGESDREHPWPVEWTTRLQRLTTILSGAVDTAALARAVVEHGRAALGAYAGVVFLLSPDGESLEIAHTAGYAPETVGHWVRFPLSAPVPAAETVRTRKVVLLRSKEELRQRYPMLAATATTPESSAAVTVPLVVDGVGIGALGLSFLSSPELGTPQVSFLQVVADQCAQALQRGMLTERERRSTARLRALAEASRVFAAANPDVCSVLDAIAAEVLAHLSHSCSISLASPDGESLLTPAVHDQDPARAQRLRALAASLRIRRGEGLTGKVLATGQSVLLPSLGPGELSRQILPSISEEAEELRARSLLIVPLTISGRTLGTISAARYDEDNPFTDEDRTLLEDLADRAALAVENARLHEAERQARARAEEADRRKDEFLAMLGHELRNPLAPIWTAIEIMRQLPADNDRLVWAREAIARQATLLARLVDDLLDISRINLGKIELRLESLDLGTVALQALEASRPLLTERHHEVSVELPSAPVRVQGDAVRLTQVISNLLNNAAKYTDPAGRVRLTVTRDGAEAVVTVEDSGIGIPAGMLGRVFDLFAQGADARERAQGGIGIGLTLVKRLVEMHGGSVHATSAGEGRGSEFVVRFPSADAGAGAHAGREPAAGHRHVARRVLIADDNADAAEGLRQLLELQSHEVEVVHDGGQAVAAVARFDPDVALLDIGLPGLDGLEVARQVRARGGPQRPLLVAITGLAREDDRRRTAAAGFDHHLVKPVDLASLEALLAAEEKAPS